MRVVRSVGGGGEGRGERCWWGQTGAGGKCDTDLPASATAPFSSRLCAFHRTYLPSLVRRRQPVGKMYRRVLH